MDNIFRTKKFRETASRSNTSDTVSGTLDSLHQNIINNIKDSDIADIKQKIQDIKQKIGNLNSDKSIEAILTTTKLQLELNELEHTLNDKTPVENYYLNSGFYEVSKTESNTIYKKELNNLIEIEDKIKIIYNEK